jgi:RNA polymerase sigma factor (sigma-70 family)
VSTWGDGAVWPPDDIDLRRLLEHARRVAVRQGAGEEAEDVAQEVVLRLTRLAEPPDDVDAWLTVVARRCAIDLHRRAERRPNGVEEVDDTVLGPRAVSLFLARQVPTSAQGMYEPVMDQLWAVLHEQLNDRECEVVRLLADGHSHEQIAEELGYANAATVKTTVRRIRAKVDTAGRRLLEEFRSHPRPY